MSASSSRPYLDTTTGESLDVYLQDAIVCLLLSLQELDVLQNALKRRWKMFEENSRGQVKLIMQLKQLSSAGDQNRFRCGSGKVRR